MKAKKGSRKVRVLVNLDPEMLEPLRAEAAKQKKLSVSGVVRMALRKMIEEAWRHDNDARSPSPPEWRVHKGTQVVTDDGDLIAIPLNENAEERARLIANAPRYKHQCDRLLVTLRGIRAHLNAVQHSPFWDEDSKAALKQLEDQASAAISECAEED